MNWFNKFIKNKTKFILISTQRSGTTLLTEYLSSHKDIYMGKELFKISGEGHNVDEDSYRNFNGVVKDFLDTFYSKRSKEVTACGFKVMADQIEQFPEIEEYIKNNNILCIYLERSNILHTAVSRLLARIRKVYHTDEKIVLKPEIIDVDKLKNELDILDKTNKKLRNFATSFLCKTIYYENLIANKEESTAEILEFLKISNNSSLYSNLKKINSDNLRNIIDNYDDVVNMLLSTRYISYLNQGTAYKEFNDTLKIIFVHIPKVAGSSIEKALFQTHGKVGHHCALDYIRDDAIRFDHYFTFAFVRHPLDRFVSAYEYLLQGGRNQHDKAWAEKNIFPHKSFKSFVLSLNDETQKNHILSWMHFKPQYLFVCDTKQNILVDFIGRYEDLEDNFNTIVKKLSLNVILPYENKTAQRNDYHEYYDAETLQIIYRIYHLDFKLFNYTI